MFYINRDDEMYYINHDEIYYINHDEMYYMNNNENVLLKFISYDNEMYHINQDDKMSIYQAWWRVFISTMTKWKYILKLNIKKMHVVNKPW